MTHFAKILAAAFCASLALPVTGFAAGDGIRETPKERVSFSPARGIDVTVSLAGQVATVAVTNAGQVASEEIAVETEKKIKINLADYNFDGHMDFSLSHTDDGMGTYQIYQIYVYSPSEHKFVQLTPKCGDEFINVVLSRPSQRTLTNSYVSQNQFKNCKAKY
jgi:hypothetical protein